MRSDGTSELRITGLWPEDPTDIIAKAFVAYVESKDCRFRRYELPSTSTAVPDVV
jgi:hypothetical protein